MHRPLVALVALAAVGVLAAGCSNGSNSGSGSGSGASGSGRAGYGGGGSATTGGTASGVATVATARSKLGMILVDGSGRTLYLFKKDQPNQSACSGACVAAWPVAQSGGTPKAGSGVKASLLGTISRGDNTTQVTYDHHPLYHYSGDSNPGDTNGQNVDAFGAEWYVVAPAGGAVTGGLIGTGPGKPAPPRCPPIVGRRPDRRSRRGSCGSRRRPRWGSTPSSIGGTRRPTTPSGLP